jgi:hypothetical protein
MVNAIPAKATGSTARKTAKKCLRIDSGVRPLVKCRMK